MSGKHKLTRDIKTKHNDPRDESFTLTYVVHGIRTETEMSDLYSGFDKVVMKKTGQTTLDEDEEDED